MGLCMSKIKYLNSLSNLNIQASQVQASVECIHVLKKKNQDIDQNVFIRVV